MKELLSQNWIFIATGMFLAIMGVLIQKLKLYSVIAGYNTSSPEEKRKVNIARVAISMRNAFLIMGAMWILIHLVSDLLKFKMVVKVLLVTIAHVGITTVLLITTNRKEKYKLHG